MRSCGVFEFPENTGSCTLESPLPDDIKDENTSGPMQGLPGGCEVQSGPEEAAKGKGATGSSSGGKSGGASSSGGQSDSQSPVAKDTSSSSSNPPAANNKAEGAVFADVNDNKPADYQAPAPAAPAPQPTTTSPPVAPAPVDQAGNVVSTDIYTDGRIVHENKVVVQEVTVTEGMKAKRTPEAKAKRHGHRHHHAQQHGIGGRRMR